METPTPPLPEGCMVLLKSGGPLMMTERTHGDTKIVSVVWFSTGGVCQRDRFHFDALVVVGMPRKSRDDSEMWDIAEAVVGQARRKADEDIANASRE